MSPSSTSSSRRSTASRVWAATLELRRNVRNIEFAPPVTHVYNPLEYAAKTHRLYVDRFANGRRRVIFLGMNPGPYGMVQTGVPFGEITAVRDWLGIEGAVGRPSSEHPKRPVDGFACTRSEVSGARVWGTIAKHFGTPRRFFTRHYIANYCPLVFMEMSGRNRTPDKLAAHEREALFSACDRHLRRLVSVLEPEWVVGIGAFAAKRAAEVLGDRVQIGRLLHPSPANPRANRDWEGEVIAQLSALGLCAHS